MGCCVTRRTRAHWRVYVSLSADGWGPSGELRAPHVAAACALCLPLWGVHHLDRTWDILVTVRLDYKYVS